MTSPIASQIAAVREEMADRPSGLVRHARRVLIEALSLAECWDVDAERVELATWGHDLYRAAKPIDLLTMAEEMSVPVSQEEEDNPMLLHGPVAACVLSRRFEVTDEDVLSAIQNHTLGAPEMSTIAKIMLLSDKFESKKRKRTPIMKNIRSAARSDLDLALLSWADWRWVENRTRDIASPPLFWTARTRWVGEHHLEFLRTAPSLVEDDGWYAAAEAIEPPPDRRSLEERRSARRARDENNANLVR